MLSWGTNGKAVNVNGAASNEIRSMIIAHVKVTVIRYAPSAAGKKHLNSMITNGMVVNAASVDRLKIQAMNSTVSKAQKDMESAGQKALLINMLATGVQRRTAIM